MPVARSFFQRIPYIRITSLFLAGILINHCLSIDFRWIGLVLTILISILILLWHNSNFSAVKIQNYIISMTIILSGVFYPQKKSEKNLPNFDMKDYYLAEVCQKPVEKVKTYQTILQIQSRSLPKKEKVIAYFSKENFDTTITSGDQLIILIKPQGIKNMGNPYEFDFRTMMNNKGIYFSVYLSPQTYRKTGIKINRLIYKAEQVRDKLMTLLNATKIKKEERAVLSALTLGYRAELDPETLDSFIDTGTIHVLSVSGLHVALIFLILSFILSGINKGKAGKILFPVIMIIFLWAYAFITGFSPSVQRSTVMFTFVIGGNILRRPINIYNSLSASALVLMLLDPSVLFDVGFQLSYLAVFGIVLLQKPIENLIQLKNKILIWLWTMLTVSLAAQLITFPLSILYFNQFPNFFWLSNYFVIPATTFIIWLTFGFFTLNFMPVIPNLIAQLIQVTMHLMLNLLKWISQIPHAVSKGIVYSPIQVWIIYGILAAFVIYGFSKKKNWLFAGLILFIFFQISSLLTKADLFNQKEVFVYNSKHPFIHFINSRGNYVLLNGVDSITEQEMNIIRNVQKHLKLEEPKLINLKSVKDLKTKDLIIKDKSILFLNCRIGLTKQINFQIKSTNLQDFRSKNTELVKKGIIKESLSFDISDPNRKQAFSIDFTAKYKEPLFLSLN